MSDSLYQKYGGAPAVSVVVQDFYKRLLADADLSATFANVDMPKLIAHQTNFIGKALGGPEIYTGRDLKKVHAPLEITDDAFNAVAGHLGDALSEAGFSEEDCKATLELVGSLRGDVVSSS